MASKEKTKKTCCTVDDLERRFNLLSTEIQQIFGFDNTGHANHYEMQMNKITDDIDELKQRIGDIARENDEINDRLQALEYIVNKNTF